MDMPVTPLDTHGRSIVIEAVLTDAIIGSRSLSSSPSVTQMWLLVCSMLEAEQCRARTYVNLVVDRSEVMAYIRLSEKRPVVVAVRSCRMSASSFDFLSPSRDLIGQSWNAASACRSMTV
jgi:hypothetical protein